MTINYKDQLKLPSRELFLECLNERSYPFSIRARVVKAYRKIIARGEVPPIGLEPLTFPQPVEYPDVLDEEPFKTAKEKKLEKAKDRVAKAISRRAKEGDYLNEDQGSPKNAKRRNSLQPVVRWTSGGKGRPSRKRKVQFIARTYTLHLRGNKYSGGQDEF